MDRRYPLSDHYDGRHFFNPDTIASSRGLLEVLRWRMRGEHVAWPTLVSDAAFPPPSDLVATGGVAITFIMPLS